MTISSLRLFQPTWRVLLVFAILMAASSLAVRESVPTSKIHWDIWMGWPMAYLRLSRYHGPCGPIAGCNSVSIRDGGVSLCDSHKICLDFSVRGFDAGKFGIDLVIAYVAASVLSHGLSVILQASKVKAIVTGKR